MAMRQTAPTMLPIDGELDQPVETFVAPPLPYDYDALAPVISAETLRLHHLKHHQGYADKLNELLATSKLRGKSLQEIIVATAGDPKQGKIFNNAAQVWNHSFYWQSMRPRGGGRPAGELADRIAADFGSFEAFADAFKKTAVEQFGSGWAWLTLDGGTLRLVGTGNAETPLTGKKQPLLTIDVWEHAYYLDYQNKRPDYVAAWLEKLANWDFAAANLAKA
jgi:superoxide dismutase, Fe-Mn family